MERSWPLSLSSGVLHELPYTAFSTTIPGFFSGSMGFYLLLQNCLSFQGIVHLGVIDSTQKVGSLMAVGGVFDIYSYFSHRLHTSKGYAYSSQEDKCPKAECQ